jgi:LmbE family N-acetylglucosaminyl deacetylase
LDEFCREGSPAALIVAAHPDDETIGAAARLMAARDVRIVHVTDGAPRNLDDARRCGFATAAEYSDARRRELRDALAVAEVGMERTIWFGYADQEAAFHLEEIAGRLRRVFQETAPALVLTHPYEGGHPDHDACAFAVHRGASGRPIVVAEFASYHAIGDGPLQFHFLPGGGAERLIPLNDRQQAVKRRMLDCFRTQKEILAPFGVSVERFRLAPQYRFLEPPHPGRLHYERHPWGMTGERFRGLVNAHGS